MFNVIQELARFGERFDDPFVEHKKAVVIELDGHGKVRGTRTEKGVRALRWGYRSGVKPVPQPLCDLGHYVLGFSNDPKKADFARRCRLASRDLHRDLARKFPEISELEAVSAFLGKRLPRSLTKLSSKDKYVFEVNGVLLAGEKLCSMGTTLSKETPSTSSGEEWECAFTGEKGPLFCGTLPSFKGPWVNTQRKSFVVCNRPVIDHGYFQDDAITNPMSPRVARLHSKAPSAMAERGQLVQLFHTVTLLWTREEHPIETFLPRVLRGHEHARNLEAFLGDLTPLYILVSGSAHRASVLHADVKPVTDVVNSVLDLYGPRRDEPWDLIWWIQLINKQSRSTEPNLTITQAASWMRSILSREPLPQKIIQGLVVPPRGRPPTDSHVRIASCRMS